MGDHLFERLDSQIFRGKEKIAELWWELREGNFEQGAEFASGVFEREFEILILFDVGVFLEDELEHWRQVAATFYETFFGGCR